MVSIDAEVMVSTDAEVMMSIDGVQSTTMYITRHVVY